MANNNRITKGEASVGRLVADDEIKFTNARGSVTNVYSIDKPAIIDFDTTENGSIDYRQGRMKWDYDYETLDLGIGLSHNLLLGQELLMLVQNDSGDDLLHGTLVMGETDNNGRLKTVGIGIIKVVKAITDGTIDSKLLVGVVSEDIPNGDRGYIVVQGRIQNFNTQTLDAGTILYNNPNTAGALGTAIPVAPNFKLPLAVVTKKATQGQIYVRMTQGSKLGETDSNVQITSPTDGQVLMYDGTAGYWYNADLP
jgi:hypothetical protein